MAATGAEESWAGGCHALRRVVDLRMAVRLEVNGRCKPFLLSFVCLWFDRFVMDITLLNFLIFFFFSKTCSFLCICFVSVSDYHVPCRLVD